MFPWLLRFASAAPSSDAALGLPIVTGAINPGKARARGEVTGAPLFGTFVFWVPVEET